MTRLGRPLWCAQFQPKYMGEGSFGALCLLSHVGIEMQRAASQSGTLVIHVGPEAVSGQSWGGISPRSGLVLKVLLLGLSLALVILHSVQTDAPDLG
jgi:hypothetical protein